MSSIDQTLNPEQMTQQPQNGVPAAVHNNDPVEGGGLNNLVESAEFNSQAVVGQEVGGEEVGDSVGEEYGEEEEDADFGNNADDGEDGDDGEINVENNMPMESNMDNINNIFDNEGMENMDEEMLDEDMLDDGNCEMLDGNGLLEGLDGNGLLDGLDGNGLDMKLSKKKEKMDKGLKMPKGVKEKMDKGLKDKVIKESGKNAKSGGKNSKNGNGSSGSSGNNGVGNNGVLGGNGVGSGNGVGGAKSGKSGSGGAKKGAKQEQWARYIHKVLKSVHADSCALSTSAMSILDSFTQDLLTKITNEAVTLMRHTDKRTLTSSEIQTAAKLCLPGELSKHSIAEGIKAENKFKLSQDLMGNVQGGADYGEGE